MTSKKSSSNSIEVNSFGIRVAAFGGGILIRLVLLYFKMDEILSYRPELSTPITSIHRVREGCFLIETDKSPYLGDVFHQPPLILALFCPLLKHFEAPSLHFFWIAIDLIIAQLLIAICKVHLTQEECIKQDEKKGMSYCPLSPLLQPSVLPSTVAAIYMLNPFTVATCISMSTISLTYLCIAAALLALVHHRTLLAGLSLATAAYISVYPMVLALPFCFFMRAPKLFLLSFIACSVYLQCMSCVLLGNSTAYLMESYLWIVQYRDLTPNVGIYWYFFMEMFERFRNYFLLVLHLHPYFYLVPISYRMKNRPHAMTHVLFAIFSLFQAYPSMGDLGFALSLFAMHPHSLSYIQNRYVLAIGLSVGAIMMPVMWYLWLYPASGNANFYYNQTLVYQIFYSMILIGFIKSTMRRDKLRQQFYAS